MTNNMIDAKTARAIKGMSISQLSAYLYKVRAQGFEAGFKEGLKTKEAIKEIGRVVSGVDIDGGIKDAD